MTPEIDAVITWVDGAQSAHYQNRMRYMAAAVTPLRATIGNGTYAVWSERQELYVDELMREYRKVLPRR